MKVDEKMNSKRYKRQPTTAGSRNRRYIRDVKRNGKLN